MPNNTEEFYRNSFFAPLTNKSFQPRAWKVDTELLQLYEIPNCFSKEECQMLIDVMCRNLYPSGTTTGEDQFRTSYSSDIKFIDSGVSWWLEQKLSPLVGMDPSLSEPPQGQKYSPGQYFRAHRDFFYPGTKEYDTYATVGGQRTWTVMVYLNTCLEGGETVFHDIGRSFQPTRGTVIAWNNLHADGYPNYMTMHESMPVIEGEKYIITKWYRDQTGLNNY